MYTILFLYRIYIYKSDIPSHIAGGTGLSATVAVRSVLGFCSGVVYPVLSAMFGRWITSVDRSKAYAVADFGGILGAAGSGKWTQSCKTTTAVARSRLRLRSRLRSHLLLQCICVCIKVA